MGIAMALGVGFGVGIGMTNNQGGVTWRILIIRANSPCFEGKTTDRIFILLRLTKH